MSRRRGSENPVSLFPFLAVLISAMGGLILLLLVVSRQANQSREEELRQARLPAAPVDFVSPALPERETYPPVATESLAIPELVRHELKPLPELTDPRPELEQKREAASRRLVETQKEAAKLAQATADDPRLAELSQAVEQLEEELRRIEESRKEEERRQAELNREIKTLEVSADDARRKAQGQASRYSIVPYFGVNGTDREPVYFECRADRILLQPLGLEILPSDLPDPLSMDNALAQVLRALLTYERSKGDRPYPLLVVRPDGIATYYIARTAMSAVGTDYGYELVSEKIDLEFGEPDAKAVEIARAVLERERLKPRSVARGPNVFRVDVGDGQGGEDGPAGAGSGEEVFEGGIARRSTKELTEIARGLPTLAPPGGTSSAGSAGPKPPIAGRTQPGGSAWPAASASGPLGSREVGVAGEPASGGKSKAESGPLFRGASGGKGPSETPSSLARAAQHDAEGTGLLGEFHRERLERGASASGHEGGQNGAGDPGSSTQGVPRLSSRQRSSAATGRSSGSTSSQGSSRSASTEFEQILAEMQPSSSSTQRSTTSAEVAPGAPPGDSPVATSDASNAMSQPASPLGPTGSIRQTVERSVLVECRSTGVTLYPEGKYLPIDASTNWSQIRREIYRHVATQMLTWGSASELYRWAPVLEVNVRPNGLPCYYDLRLAMAGSGISVRRRLISWREDLSFEEFQGEARPAESARRPNDDVKRR